MPKQKLETDWIVSPQNAHRVCRVTGTNEHGEPVYQSVAMVCGVGPVPKERAKQIAASGRALDALADAAAIIGMLTDLYGHAELTVNGMRTDGSAVPLDDLLPRGGVALLAKLQTILAEVEA